MKISFQYYDKLPIVCRQIREKVFMEEQGFINEFDKYDEISTHIVMYKGQIAIGTSRFYLDYQGDIHLGRIAVLKSERGHHYGDDLMRYSIQLIKEQYPKHLIIISAQIQAKEFYEKLGFKATGTEYLDEHTPHIDMYI